MPSNSNDSPPEKLDPASFRFIEVTRETRGRFETLFEQPGAPKYCWCMAWRHSSREHIQNDEKKRMMMARIDAGTPVGILAELDGGPVGWCSVAPRETYRRLSKQQDDSETGIWSIVCFYVPRALRGGGLASALLDAAIDHAFSKGALIIEAYPVDEAAPSYRFMGFRDMFAARGFQETGTAGTRRHVMRLNR
ncbi:GNAT family N-acetyltransferase [Mesorhizobium sp. M2C.T.Ca.TU.002.02.1.1]|uniref:GNAT family N-acetyltransferase n=1 Tax=Mesorhizobium sp. M2C.T.Ca.TU.002.02.1.1 TaxID=2496788 RepID=UPI000FCAF7CD|nr:GNAT family N-acetyltransferase [Mesorhizobium sp. M2C.T.Ca.TU.002.02.1.1]RUU52145.1 GNAT family N-acetyltransferase [Mesorhizobium sp. M2C.T.Ca.TU.002.02.1.1]RUU61291.1 GNAT family N-acetyltransferase [Mesorhizobium sp. M2C.T.Ca.TU.009.01.2.1]